jgi:hypothetical protein
MEEFCMCFCCATQAFFIESRKGNELWWTLDWIESPPVSGKLDCASISQAIGRLRLDPIGKAIHCFSIGSVDGIAISSTVGMVVGETIHMSIGDLKSIAVYEIEICVGRRQRSCIMSRGQPSVLEVVKSIIENNMAVCTPDSKGIDRDPAQAGRGPRRRFKRELKPPFCCRDLRVDFLEIDVWGDDPILKDKNRFDDAARLLAVFQQPFNTQINTYAAAPAAPSK